MNDYYEALKKELLSKCEQLKTLTYGRTQSKIQGDYYEALIRDFVSRFIDEKLAVKRGLIHNEKSQTSPECDIIIYEKEKRPLFESGDTVIVNPDSVRFVIQVKSTLTSDTLKKAIDNLKEVKKLNKNIMCWIVGFETKTLFRTMYKNARESGSIRFLHAFPSKKMSRENESLFDSQMKIFVDLIRQCGAKSAYGHSEDFVIYREGIGKPALLLGEDPHKNKTILDEIYAKGLWKVMESRNKLVPSFEHPHE